MNQGGIDIVSVCVLIATAIFAPDVAIIVGPYIVIVLASTIGASFALARRERSTRVSAALFFLRISGLAVVLTVGLATWANSYRPDLHERLLLAPIALAMGFVGDDWMFVLRWVLRRYGALIDLLAKIKGNGNG